MVWFCCFYLGGPASQPAPSSICFSRFAPRSHVPRERNAAQSAQIYGLFPEKPTYCPVFNPAQANFGKRSMSASEKLPTCNPHGIPRPCEQSVTQCRTLQEVPPSGSYRLRRHFPRLCNSSTRVRHPYRPSFLRPRKNEKLKIHFSSTTGYAPSGYNDLVIEESRMKNRF